MQVMGAATRCLVTAADRWRRPQVGRTAPHGDEGRAGLLLTGLDGALGSPIVGRLGLQARTRSTRSRGCAGTS
jgi:hypothetical protein